MAEDIFNQFHRAHKLREEAGRKNAENYKKQSRERLNTNIEKKVRTTMIGSLDSFEKNFSELWGDRLPFRELTPDQQYFRRKWESCRKEVLDKGNNELRAARNEIGEYDVSWNRYHTDFKIWRSNEE